MSHTTKVSSIKFTDIDALSKTVAELKSLGVNCELLRNVKPRMYYSSQHQECKYVLALKDCPYDVGFDYDEVSKGYVPVFDNWQGLIGKHLGCKCPTKNEEEKLASSIGKLVQLYSKHAIINEASNNGYVVEDSFYDEQGNLQLVVNLI